MFANDDTHPSLESCTENLLKASLDDFSNNIIPAKKDLLSSALNNNIDYFNPNFTSCPSVIQSRIADCHTPPPPHSQLSQPGDCDNSDNPALQFDPPVKLPSLASSSFSSPRPSPVKENMKAESLTLMTYNLDSPCPADHSLGFDSTKTISSLQPQYISL